MNLDIAIFVVFLVVNVVLGLYSSSGIKNIKEYAIGNRNFSTATIAATIVATWISGNSFGMAAFDSHSEGIFFLIPGTADIISFFIIAYFIAPRVGEFLGTLSVADAMGGMYGEKVRVVSAISAIIPAIGNIAIQFVILIGLLSNFLGVSGIYATALSCIVVISYSTLGGIRAITFTDTIQFFTFGILIPIIAYFIWNSIGDVQAIWSTLSSNPIFDFNNAFNPYNSNFINTLFILLFFSIPGLDPALFQRISMAKDTKQVAKSFFISALVMFFCVYLVFWFIGVLVLTNTNTQFSPNELISYILNNYLNVGIKGMFVISIVAMIMSTADSYINCSAIMFVHDFCKPLGIKFTEKKQLLLAKISALIIGVSALLLSLYSKNLIYLILSTYSFYMPIVSVPLLLAIFGFRSDSKSVLIGMVAGFLTVIYFKIFTQIDSLIPGMLANTIIFISSHYLLKADGGWIGIKDQASLDIIKAERKYKINGFYKNIKNFSFIKVCRSNLPTDQSMYVYYGFFCLISIFANVYSTPHNVHSVFSSVISWIYYSVLIISTIFITYPVWSVKFKNEIFISILWNFSIIYNLVFVSSLLVLINQFSNIQLVVLMADLITVALLLRWQAAILLMPLAVILSSIFYKMLAGSLPESSTDYTYRIVYSLLFIASILVAFLKPKQEHQELTEEKAEHLASTMEYKDDELHKALKLKNEFIRNVTHEYHAPMTGVINTAEALLSGYQFLDDDRKIKAIETIYNSAIRLESFDANIRDLARLSSNEAELSITKVNLSSLVIDRLNICKKLYIENAKQNDYQFIINLEDNIFAEADEYYIKQTLDNLIINALTYCKEGQIKLDLTQKNDLVKFSITDQGIGIPKEEIYDIFGEFTVSSKTRTPAGGRGVGLALCKKVLEMHKGSLEADSKKGETSFTFSLPVVFDYQNKPLSKEMLEVAKKLLENGVDVKLIAKYTGLKESQIKALKK